MISIAFDDPLLLVRAGRDFVYVHRALLVFSCAVCGPDILLAVNAVIASGAKQPFSKGELGNKQIQSLVHTIFGRLPILYMSSALVIFSSVVLGFRLLYG